MSRNFLFALAAFVAPCLALAFWRDAPPLVLGMLTFVAVAAGWIVAVSLHEFGHALAAHYGGDHTIRGQGYLTLDPLKYAHPLTSFIIPLAFIVLGGIGFPGAAVSIRLDLLKSRVWRTLTALAGPAATLVVVVLLGIPFLLGLDRQPGPAALWDALALLAFLQGSALVLNLLPLPGLDGYAAVRPYIKGELGRRLAKIDRHPGAGLLTAALIFMIPGVSGLLMRAGMLLVGLLGVEPLRVIIGLAGFRFWSMGG